MTKILAARLKALRCRATKLKNRVSTTSPKLVKYIDEAIEMLDMYFPKKGATR